MKTLLTLLITIIATPTLAGELVKWVDENGSVHYGDALPPGATALGVDTSSVNTMSSANIQRTQELSKEFDLRREIKNKEAAERQAEQQKQLAACQKAQARLALLNKKIPLYTKDDSGERYYMSDEERHLKINHLEQMMRKNC